MRKLSVWILIVMLLFASGCGDSHSAAPEDTAFLTSADYWYHYSESLGENEKMRFSEDFSFFWGCECGEPVGDSDLYQLYDYDKDKQVIRLYSDVDNASEEIKVLDYSDYHLLLKIDGQIRGYTFLDAGINPGESSENLSDYSLYASIIEGDDKTAVLGPFNYDGDAAYPDNAIKSYPVAKQAEFFDLNVKITEKDGQTTRKTFFKELTRKEAASHMENTTGFIWLNEKMEIEKIVFYGAVHISR